MKTAMILVAFCFAVSASAATQYELMDIASGNVHITDINNAGAVVGYIDRAGGTDAFSWQDGTFTILNSVAGSVTRAYGINDSGYIVGSSSGQSLVWHGASVSNLGIQGNSSAVAVNNNNEVVGNSASPYHWQNGTVTFLDGSLYLKNINATGTIVGGRYGGLGDGDFAEAFKIENGELELLLPRHSADTSQSIAHDINDHGQIVGIAGSPFNPHGKSFFWEDGVATIYLNTTLNSINNFGRAVGSGDGGAILLDSGQIFNLHDLLTEPTDMALYEANAINDLGWIAGIGEMPNGDRHAWLLKPVPEPTALVPLALMLLFRKR